MVNRKEGFIHVSGGRIFYVTFGDINSTAAPLIVVHGGPGFSHDTLEITAPLARDRFLILYDQLGCGRSDRPTDKTLWSLRRYASELDAIVSYFHLDRYHLLGHSFGGSVVLEHSLTHPQGLMSIILSSPLVSVKDWLADTATRKKELPQTVQSIIDHHEVSGTTDSDDYKKAVSEFNRRFLCRLLPRPDSYQNAFKRFNNDIYQQMWGPSEFHCTGSLASYNRANDLDKINVPACLLCGDQDEVRETTIKKYAEKLQARYHILPNSTHSTYLEATTTFMARVDQFLQQVESN
ncbi:MAG: proline iminopeptidase-family hydrolase [Pseudomonadota bacterium]